MIVLREAAYGLFGAWRLARFDASGLNFFDTSTDGFWKSFHAALIVAPLYGILIYADLVFGHIGDVDGLHFVLIRIITYVIGWVIFPLVMVEITRTMKREKHYLGFIIAYNWSAVIQYAVFTPIALFMAGDGQLASPIGFLGLGIMGYMLVYTWFVARSALAITGGTAAMVVVTDVVLTMLVNIVSEGLIQRGGAAMGS
jgi:hypothetical protein